MVCSGPTIECGKSVSHRWAQSNPAFRTFDFTRGVPQDPPETLAEWRPGESHLYVRRIFCDVVRAFDSRSDTVG